MSRTDIKNSITPAQSIRPGARTASINGTGVDLANFDAAVVVIDAGAWTDGSHTFAVQDSDDNVTFAAVAAAYLDGTAPVISGATADDQIYTVGYHGIRRYLRVITTVTGATTGAAYGASVVCGRGRVYP